MVTLVDSFLTNVQPLFLNWFHNQEKQLYSHPGGQRLIKVLTGGNEEGGGQKTKR